MSNLDVGMDKGKYSHLIIFCVEILFDICVVGS